MERPRLALWSKALAVACYLTGAAFLAALAMNLASAAWPQVEATGAWALAALVSGTVVDLLSELVSQRR